MDDDVKLRDSDPADADEASEHGEVSSKRKIDHEEEPRKRFRADTLAEDKTRGRRLFGSLLGTLGGNRKEVNSAKFQERAARQVELEQRQQQRQQELDEEITKKQAEDNARRKQRQKEAEATMKTERLKNFHAHQVVLARNLLTKAEPPIYFRPWELTKEQEQRIASQVRRAKEEQAKATQLLDKSEAIDGGEQVTEEMDTTSPDAHKDQAPEDVDMSENNERPEKPVSAADIDGNKDIDTTAEPAAEKGIIPAVDDSIMKDHIPDAQVSAVTNGNGTIEAIKSRSSPPLPGHMEHKHQDVSSSLKEGPTAKLLHQDSPEAAATSVPEAIEVETLPAVDSTQQTSQVVSGAVKETVAR